MTASRSVIQDVDSSSDERVELLRNLPPGSRIHISGVCGTGMVAVARVLKDSGFVVTGSDRAFYPPMGEVARSTCDQVFEGYDEKNLSTRPALVIIGNSIRRDNPEAVAVFRDKIPYASMPEVFRAFLIGSRAETQHSIVVAGTHGKTTTTAAIATLLDQAGRQPGYFIGGVPLDLADNVRRPDRAQAPSERIVVLEGDEYDSAFFAKWPKFHSYRPDLLVLTSLEFDHADIYSSVEEIEAEFFKLMCRVPPDGVVFVMDRDERLRKLSTKLKNRENAPRIVFYGTQAASDFCLLERNSVRNDSHGGQHLLMRLGAQTVECDSPLIGEHNALNVLVAAGICVTLNITLDRIRHGVGVFRGVKRRQQKIGKKNGVLVYEDFAHHPTAVRVTLQGFREAFPDRRIIAVFEPRSNTSRRGFFQDDYERSFSAADCVIIRHVSDPGSYSGTGGDIIALDTAKLVNKLHELGKIAKGFATGREIFDYLLNSTQEGDVIVVMSNGDFDGLPQMLGQAFQEVSSDFTASV